MAKERTITLALLLWMPVNLWARPGGAVERKPVELRFAKLEERLQISPATGEGGFRETQILLATSRLELAKKLLGRSNLRAADVVAGEAERALERAEKKEARQ